jgi:8-oxo-dGTP diphosphatase
MQHRISAGALVVQDSRILLVRHQKVGVYDFWVAPGGGVIENESLAQAAAREVKEESGLEVEPGRPVYFEEFFDSHTRHLKVWFICQLLGGALSTAAQEATREHIIDARFFTESEIKGEPRDVFPEILRNAFWDDFKSGFPSFRHLSLRKMAYS